MEKSKIVSCTYCREITNESQTTHWKSVKLKENSYDVSELNDIYICEICMGLKEKQNSTEKQ